MRKFYAFAVAVVVLCGFAGNLLAEPQLESVPGLHVGDMAPDFTAKTHDGGEITLSELYEDGPLVLIFYRGAWCPYCNLQLQEFQAAYQEFESREARVLAVSVDLQESANKTVVKNGLSFPVVSDPQANILKAYKLVFEVPEDLREKYKNEYGIDLEQYSGRTDGVISVPATYLIGQDGTIIFAYANKDYKTRIHPNEVLQAMDLFV